MARLLRAHFASIGHRDARLAPLTLDFRHAGKAGGDGRAADTVLWLRNGGGKSSILNLFYSVFRPSAREFLGSSAEGRARRLGDYVGGRDLAFVVTEWDVDPADGLELFATSPTRVRIVGQALAWKGQRPSADLANLRRLFFSLLARDDADLAFDALPIHGLGEPVESLDAFRQWLRDAGHAHGAQEVVHTENQKAWLSHLEAIGLDPELFRYQLKMNQREGAADEAFRFGRDEDFVRFLLELALDPQLADGVAQNLGAQRENLRARPSWELERRFVSGAVGAVRELAASVHALRRDEGALAEVTAEVAAVTAGLEARERGAAADVAAAEAEAEAAREDERRTRNEIRTRQRWAGGLERLALVLDVAEARAALDAAEERLAAVHRDLRHAVAAGALAGVRTLEVREADLRAALSRERKELEPLRLAACARGGALYGLLHEEQARLEAAVTALERDKETCAGAEAEAAARLLGAREQRGGAESERKAVEAQIERRDRAREALSSRGALEPREPASDAAARWRRHVEEHERALEDAAREKARLDDDVREVATRREEAVGELAGARSALARLDRELDAGLAWRDRLVAHARIHEVEEVTEPDLDAPGLVDRLRRRAAASRRWLLESRVEGAEDERSLEWLREHGLLPSPLEVRRVVAALREAGHAAHAGPEYLEQNLPAPEAAARLRADPARFGGAIVASEAALAAASGLALPGLRAPVQVTLLSSLALPEAPPHAEVVLPDAALWDRAAADERQAALSADATRRADRERELTEEENAHRRLADELGRYLEAHGGGELARLERRAEDARAHVGRLEREVLALGERRDALRAALAATEERAAAARAERERGERARADVERFIETHEAHIEEARRRKDELVRAIRGLEEEAERAKSEAAAHRSRAEALTGEIHAQGRLASDARAERDAIAHRAPTAEGAPPMSLDAARGAYDTARRAYEGRLSDSRIQWELERCEEALAEGRAEVEDLGRGLERERIERLAERADLSAERARLEAGVEERREQVAARRATHEHAERVLREQPDRRREGDDLPADRARPEDAATARRVAKELEAEAEQLNALAAAALERAGRHAARRGEAERLADRCRSQAKLLRASASTAGVELPALPPRSVPTEPDAIVELVDALQARFSAAMRRATESARGADRRASAVAAIANRTEFQQLDAQYRERMKDPAELLFEEAAGLAEQLERRLSIADRALADIDEDRRLIVDQLLQLSDSVKSLLTRAESASRLPETLEGWGRRPYLRIAFSFPELDEERRARLEPLVDRIVGQAQLPTGLELVLATAVELAGPRGFDVKILKPDTVLRPEHVPLSAMSTFSRGQQLTAAILLYCTLVQLRARSRGRARGSEDAGVLILDNPIGTCSNVALLRLQRTIAERMRVQLVYTTGVDDLDALATLPNTIRLRNSHRDRATGRYHVTAEESAEHTVQGVRLVEVPAR